MNGNVDKGYGRKSTILAILISVFILIVVFHANGWFLKITPFEQENETVLKEREGEIKEIPQQIKGKQKQKIKTSKIHVPIKYFFEKQDEKTSDTQTHALIDEISAKEEIPSFKYNEKSGNEKSFKPDDNTLKEDMLDRFDNLMPDKGVSTRDDSFVHNNKNLSNGAKKTDVTPPKESAKNIEKFDFDEYREQLIKNAGLNEGIQMPVLYIDDHNNKEIYKEGLKFYGYRLVARPKVLPKEPYYFLIDKAGMRRIDETCLYTGDFPSVLEEEQKYFEILLSKSEFRKKSHKQYDLFYVPTDTRMINLLKRKQQSILQGVHIAPNEVSKIIGSFKRVGASFLLIIELIITKDGRCLKVNDPDNRIASVG